MGRSVWSFQVPRKNPLHLVMLFVLNDQTRDSNVNLLLQVMTMVSVISKLWHLHKTSPSKEEAHTVSQVQTPEHTVSVISVSHASNFDLDRPTWTASSLSLLYYKCLDIKWWDSSLRKYGPTHGHCCLNTVSMTDQWTLSSAFPGPSWQRLLGSLSARSNPTHLQTDMTLCQIVCVGTLHIWSLWILRGRTRDNL